MIFSNKRFLSFSFISLTYIRNFSYFIIMCEKRLSGWNKQKSPRESSLSGNVLLAIIGMLKLTEEADGFMTPDKPKFRWICVLCGWLLFVPDSH